MWACWRQFMDCSLRPTAHGPARPRQPAGGSSKQQLPSHRPVGMPKPLAEFPCQRPRFRSSARRPSPTPSAPVCTTRPMATSRRRTQQRTPSGTPSLGQPPWASSSAPRRRCMRSWWCSAWCSRPSRRCSGSSSSCQRTDGKPHSKRELRGHRRRLGATTCSGTTGSWSQQEAPWRRRPC